MMPTNNIKKFMIDSSVLLHDPGCIFAFEDNELVVPMLVVDELKQLSSTPGERGASARLALRKLVSAFAAEPLLEHNVGFIDDIQRIEEELAVLDVENEPEDFDDYDDYSEGGPFDYEKSHFNVVSAPVARGRLSILDSGEEKDIVALAMRSGAILVTKDATIRLKAFARNQRVEDYKHDRVAEADRFYTGRSIIYVPGKVVSDLASTGKIPLPDRMTICGLDEHGIEIAREPNYKLTENEFVVVKDSGNPQSGGVLGRYSNGHIYRLLHEKKRPFGVTPRNVGQKFAIEALMANAEEAPLVILKGPAGTAKTFLAMACGLEQTYNESTYPSVLVTRQSSLLDESPGYLPGTEQEKISPLMRSVFDNVRALMALNGKEKYRKDGAAFDPVEELISRGTLDMQAMTFFRGRSIQNTYICVDECQNCSPQQMLTLVTRAGEGAKIVLAGDPDQIDNAFLDRYSNGLTFVSEKMRGSPLCWQITFTDDECERSPLANEAIRRMIQK